MRRSVALFVLAALASTLTINQAMAYGADLGRVELPGFSLSPMAAWFTDPHRGKLPHQQSGTAAGHRHHVQAKVTEVAPALRGLR
ncbi:hypothetical protein ACWCP6_23500 [Streptomyces sp. NPDC002004]